MNQPEIRVAKKTVKRRLTFGYSENHCVELIKSGTEYFNLLEDLINNATVSIHLQTYIFDADATGRRIARALIDASIKRNVRVSLLFDGYASQHLPFWLIESFREARIHFEWFHPLWKGRKFYFGRRLHHKIVVVDSRKALVGGLNISDRYNDTEKGKAWLDWAIYAEGNVAKHIEKICERRSRLRWKKQRKTNPEYQVKGQYRIRCRVNDWVNRNMQIWNSYLEMFRKASSTIIIMSPYFMPGNLFRKKLTEAVKRGVRVKIILGSKSDVILARYAEQYLYPWLLRNRIEIYEYQRNILHGKIATYDGKWVTAGSYNMNNLSAYASVELNVDVDNEGFARDVTNELEQIIEHDCKQITLDDYRIHTNLFQKFLQRSAYDIYRLLFFLFTFYFRQRD